MPAADSSWSPDPMLEREVRDQFTRALESYRANPNLIPEHANQEESIRVGGYANRTLLELVQNAADAMAGSDGTGNDNRVEIVLDEPNRTLYCANGGTPFTASGIRAISHAHLSDKRGDEIGRFGLGFKSVLAVTRNPQVFSRSISFEFNTERSRGRLREISGRSAALPILRTPQSVNPVSIIESDPILSELASWAATVVRLPNIETATIERLIDEIRSFRSEFLLFARNVREIRLRIRGTDEFQTSHKSRDLGGGIKRIVRPDGSGDRWLVKSTVHRPSEAARAEVGKAAARKEVTVSVAIPMTYSKFKTGEFWSYFPLMDRTSASAIFNAPWSVNEDRTNLIKNRYNQRLLDVAARLFIVAVLELRSEDDPAAHLDYLPARGREESSFAGRALSYRVPALATRSDILPDANGQLKAPHDLRPLDFRISDMSESVFEKWSESPNTMSDVPHPRCYSTNQRRLRLQEICTAAAAKGALSSQGDRERTLDEMPKRGLNEWLSEWAQGPNMKSTAEALRFALDENAEQCTTSARIIPTSNGYCSIDDWDHVYLGGGTAADLVHETFVLEDFLKISGVEDMLRSCRFTEISAAAVLDARVRALGESPSAAQLAETWEFVSDMRTQDAVEVLTRYPEAAILVPTRDGGWRQPGWTLDVGLAFASKYDGLLLDATRCVPAAAHRLGVVTDVEASFDLVREPLREDYEQWVVENVAGARGGSREQGFDHRPATELASGGLGPVSVLIMLAESGAPDAVRAEWTRKLLAGGDATPVWIGTPSASRNDIPSPSTWAVIEAGVVESTAGFRGVRDVVAPRLIEYGDVLPVFVGDQATAQKLALPESLDAIPGSIYGTALENDEWSSAMKDGAIVGFILAASRVLDESGPLPRIPARVGRTVEGRPSSSVFIAVDDGQQKELLRRQKPFLRATPEEAELLVSSLGCQRFEDSFSSTVVCEGQQETGPVLDVFPGLRESRASSSARGVTLIRAARITERASTPDGVDEKSLRWSADGARIYVADDVPDGSLLGVINIGLELGLTGHELEEARKIGEAQELESYRQEALAADDDADRLTAYFGDDDLLDALPKGLWSALEAQGMAEKMSVAELFLSVWGGDSIKQLADRFRDMGYTDVPTEWAGRPTTVAWLQRMGFGSEYAGRRAQPQDSRFIVPGAIRLSPLHDFQAELSRKLHEVLVNREEDRRARKAMLELPTGAGKTRVAVETVLRTFMNGELEGPVLWIAQSQELCEQAVQTWSTVWRGLGDERPLMVARLWGGNEVPEPDTRFSVIVATDAKLDAILDVPEYEWLWNASIVIVDEGHAAGDSTRYTRILGRLGVDGRNWERPLVGLSATPFKGKSEERTERLARRFGGKLLSAFDENPYGELADRRVLARVDHRVLEGVDVALSDEELDHARTTRRLGADVLDRVGQDDARMRILVKDILAQPWDWPILVFTPSVLSAQVLAAILRCRDVKAESVSGQTGRQERRDVIERFKNNEIQVLTNCDLLVQGFDAPGVRALYIARPTFSPNAYIQMAGRGLRGPANGGKDECQIVDMADNFGEMSQFLGFREYEELWREQS